MMRRVWRWMLLNYRYRRIDLRCEPWNNCLHPFVVQFIWLLVFSTTDSSPRRQCARTHSWTLNRCAIVSVTQTILLVWTHQVFQALICLHFGWTLFWMFGQCWMFHLAGHTCIFRINNFSNTPNASWGILFNSFFTGLMNIDNHHCKCASVI